MEMEQDEMFDARFEFDAPRFYDFEAASQGTPADEWFDTAPDGPGCKPEKSVSSREPFKQLQDNTNNQQGQPAAAAQGDEDKAQVPEQKPKKVNIVTSWGQGSAASGAAAAAAGQAGAAAAGAGGGDRPARPARKSVPVGQKSSFPAIAAGRKSVPVGRKPMAAAAAAEPSTAGVSRPTPARLHGKEPRRVSRSAPANSNRDQNKQQPGARTEPPVTRSMSRLGLGLFSPVPEHKPKYGSPPATRARTAGQQRFYTEQKAKSTMTRTKQPASAQKLHHVLAPKLKQSVRSTKALTLPDDFELETSKRCEGRPTSAQQPAKSPFKPLAERVREFQFKTPPRFKSKPTKPASNKKKSPITKAEAPRLLTSTRNRPRSCKSQQEIEEEELQQQFKARPVDTRVLSSSGQLGVPRVEKPQVTEPKPFNLRSDSRARVRRSHEQPTMQQAAAAHFKAQPLNRSILDGPTFIPHKEKHGLTKAVSPELLTKKRAVMGGPSAEAGQQAGRPRSAGQTEQQHSSHGPPKLTNPQPFRLQTEARGVLHEREMAAKLAAQEAKAKRLRRVTARPLPVTLDVPVVPPKPDPKPLTLPDPFELKSMDRHEEYEQQYRTKLQQEEEAARRAAEFKARPVKAGGPFVVHESGAPLTVPEEPQLLVDSRAIERAEFDAHMAAKMQQEEDERRRQEELKRQREEEAVKEYRKKLRFTARPMPNFDQPFYAMPSERPLTNAKTPNFASKKLKRTG